MFWFIWYVKYIYTTLHINYFSMKKIIISCLFIFSTYFQVNADFLMSENIKIQNIETSSNWSTNYNIIDNNKNTSFTFKDTDNQKMILLEFTRSELDDIFIHHNAYWKVINLYLYDGNKKIIEINDCKNGAYVNNCNLKGIVWTKIILKLDQTHPLSPYITFIEMKWREVKEPKIKKDLEKQFDIFFKKLDKKSLNERNVILKNLYSQISNMKNKTKNRKKIEILNYALWIVENKIEYEQQYLNSLKIIEDILESK